MGNVWKVIIRIAAKILGSVIALVTPMFRDEITEFVTKGYEKAKLTDNPWDDFLFQLLADLFVIPLDE